MSGTRASAVFAGGWKRIRNAGIAARRLGDRFGDATEPYRKIKLRDYSDQIPPMDAEASEEDARTYLRRLRKSVRRHTAVNHPLLARVAHVPFTREDYKVFALQHYALVGNFTTYMEWLLLRAPDSDAKQWIAKVLVDEYGERSDNKDHEQLYEEFLMACGADTEELLSTRLHRDVTGFIAEHFRIVREEPFLVGLGALGPGHEWAIPHMFPPIVQGLRRAGYSEPEIFYFTEHMEQDEDHGAWLEEALVDYAGDQTGKLQIWRGTMLSLRARQRFWSGVQDKIVRWRQPHNVHLRTQMRKGGHVEGGEVTLREWKEKVLAAGLTETPA
jgi:pyrroloquinoline quinone (PQQ) biosynthesis protein C